MEDKKIYGVKISPCNADMWKVQISRPDSLRHYSDPKDFHICWTKWGAKRWAKKRIRELTWKPKEKDTLEYKIEA